MEPVDEAERVAREVFGAGVPAVADFVAAVRRFEAMPFAVPDDPEGDGFLFQWGPVNWLPEPTFLLGVTRQLLRPADGYLQVAAEYRYAPDDATAALGSGHSWWFRSSGDPFDAWLAEVAAHPAWTALGTHPVRAFAVTADEVD